MRLALYHNQYSTCSQKVRLALAEKELSWKNRPVDLFACEHLQDWYLKLNPNGVVPTLTDDGHPVIDSSVICEYLEDTQEGPSIAPRAHLDRARMRSWMRYFEEVPTVAIRVPSFKLALLKSHSTYPERVLESGGRAGPPLRKHFYQAMVEGLSDRQVEESLERLRSTLERVEKALHGQQYLLGELTIADIVLVPTVVRMDDIGLTRMWDDLPNVASWYARIQARPSFAAAYYEGTRLRPPAGAGK